MDGRGEEEAEVASDVETAGLRNFRNLDIGMSDYSTRRMISSLLWLCASTLLTIAGFAGALPAAATVMERQGLSAGVIGLITSLVYAGVLAMAPFQPRLARRFGSVLTYQ